MKKVLYICIFLLITVGIILVIINIAPPKTDDINLIENEIEIKNEVSSPLFIESLRKREYPGENFIIEKKLADKKNYNQFIASYLSEGLKIYGLLTVPINHKSDEKYPAIVFVHGYIPPKKYSTINSYPTYQAVLARSGFVTFKPDLRGHGQSEGEPVSAHYSEKYVVDIMYAISSLKKNKYVDPLRIGYWGHSNGGEIGLRIVVISNDIKAASFWAGVVGSYEDMWETYNYKIPFLKDRANPLIEKHGLPGKNPDFWQKIDPYFYLHDITAPIEIQHGVKDKSVPIELSLHLKNELEKIGKGVDYYEYANDNHNISINSEIAWKRTVDFFNKNL